MARPYGPTGRPTRPRAHQAHPRRRLIIGAILIVSIVIAGFYFLSRSPGPPSDEFTVAHDRYVVAARAIPTAASQMFRALDFPKVDYVIKISVAAMKTELGVFRHLAKTEEGDAQALAREAAKSASLGINSASAFRDALYNAHVDDATGAREQLATAVKQLDRDSQRWQQL